MTLLRVNIEFQHLAAPSIYRHLSIDDDTGRFFGILKGSMVGTPFSGKVPSRNLDCCRSLNTISGGQPIDAPKGLDEFTRKVAERLAFDVSTGVKNSEFQPYSTNFKRRMLACTETFTVRRHHSCSCATFADCLGDLFPNLKALRVVPSNQSTRFLELCSSRSAVCPRGRVTPCPLLAKLNPRKIVLRNVGEEGFCLPNNFLWNFRKGEVVIFLPVDEGDIGIPLRLILCLTAQFPAISEVKIVFMGQNEGQTGDVDQVVSNPRIGAEEVVAFISAAAKNEAIPDQLLELLAASPAYGKLSANAIKSRAGYWRGVKSRKVTVYGLEELNPHIAYSYYGASHWQEFAAQEPTRLEIIDLIKQEVMRAAVDEKERPPISPPSETGAFARGNDQFKFRTLAEYLEDAPSRFAEINASD